MSLADLLDRATNGPRIREVSARLDLADFLDDHGYDMARLLIDMADYVREIGDALSMMDKQIGIEKERALLARFADLDTKTGGAQ